MEGAGTFQSGIFSSMSDSLSPCFPASSQSSLNGSVCLPALFAQICHYRSRLLIRAKVMNGLQQEEDLFFSRKGLKRAHEHMSCTVIPLDGIKQIGRCLSGISKG